MTYGHRVAVRTTDGGKSSAATMAFRVRDGVILWIDLDSGLKLELALSEGSACALLEELRTEYESRNDQCHL